MKQNHYKRIIEIIAAIFILLFTYTAISKLFDYTDFKNTLYYSPLLSSYAAVLAWVLPVVELIISGLLLIPQKRETGLYASFALMLILTIYLSYMVLYSPHLPCSCGGVLQQMTWPQHIWFNTGFTILAAVGIRMQYRLKTSIPIHQPV